jgi:CHASE2 domain-containing sensor protein
MRLQPSPTSSDVAIVNITQDDYKRVFHGNSPLDPSELTRLIGAIASGKPKVIGINVDTSSPVFRDKVRTQQGWPTIVWARDADLDTVTGKLEPKDVLGGITPRPTFGLAVLKPEVTGEIRHYRRILETTEGRQPSFAWAVITETKGNKTAQAIASTDDLLINYTGDAMGSHRMNLPASQVLDLSDGPDWADSGPLNGKIVLLGGSYHPVNAPPDTHTTPLGQLLGVDVHAQVIETELRGGGLKPASRFAIILLGLFEGIALLLLFERLSLRKAIVCSIVFTPALALACSFASFRSFAMWWYFSPILIATLIQQIYEHSIRDYRKSFVLQSFDRIRGKSAEANSASTKKEIKPRLNKRFSLKRR